MFLIKKITNIDIYNNVLERCIVIVIYDDI